VLVDSKGMTLYVWDNDTTAGKATCTGACAQAWPPLYVTGTPTYGAGLSAMMFSTVTGPDGSKQLAVNGKPLYLWKADLKAGDATGDGVNNFYVVGTDGKKIDAS
jgi:predicted lipoprotein with Yx(FWY)xxD motif